jgi:hypothetical protein
MTMFTREMKLTGARREHELLHGGLLEQCHEAVRTVPMQGEARLGREMPRRLSLRDSLVGWAAASEGQGRTGPENL